MHVHNCTHHKYIILEFTFSYITMELLTNLKLEIAVCGSHVLHHIMFVQLCWLTSKLKVLVYSQTSLQRVVTTSSICLIVPAIPGLNIQSRHCTLQLHCNHLDLYGATGPFHTICNIRKYGATSKEPRTYQQTLSDHHCAFKTELCIISWKTAVSYHIHRKLKEDLKASEFLKVGNQWIMVISAVWTFEGFC